MSGLLEKHLSSYFVEDCDLRNFCDLAQAATVIPALWVWAKLLSVKQGQCKSLGVVLMISQRFSAGQSAA